MRKVLGVTLCVLVLFSSIPTFSTDVSDIEDHWGKTFIDELIKKGAVSGYPDGTFKPNATITRAEFTVMLLKAQDIEPADGMGAHWGSGWKQAAVNKGILMMDEFSDLDQNITRGEIALMVTRSIGESPFKDARMMDIKDTNDVGTELKSAIYSVFDYGIVSGYSDKTFRHNQSATRAEAATMAIRTIQADKRSDNPRVFNKETLAMYDGKNGSRVLAAVNGEVYDFTDLSRWAGGSHFAGITAGKDLTKEIMEESPHGLGVLLRAVKVGLYED